MIRSFVPLILCFGALSGTGTGQSCQNSRNFFDGILESSVLEDTPTAIVGDGVCGLSTTCCSSRAIAQLKERSAADLKTALRSRRESATTLCPADKLKNTTKSFLAEQKAVIETLVQSFFIQYYSNDLKGLFDEMVDTAGEYMLKERELCGLQTLITDSASNIFKKLLKLIYNNVPNTPQFDKCCKRVYLNSANSTLQGLRSYLEPPLIRIAHIVEFSEVLSEYINAVDSEPLPNSCVDALTSLRFCDGCSGNYFNRSSRTQCLNNCKTAMSLCLNPYKAMETAAANWIDNKDEIINTLSVFEANRMFSGTPLGMLQTMQSIFYPSSPTITQLNSQCGSRMTQRTLTPRPPSSINSHEITIDLTQAAKDEVNCITSQINSVYFPSTVSELCRNATNVGCDNESERVESKLLSPNLGKMVDELILQSKFVLKVSFVCTGQCPDVQDYCWVNDLKVNKTPTAAPETPKPTTAIPTVPSTSSESVADTTSLPEPSTTSTMSSSHVSSVLTSAVSSITSRITTSAVPSSSTSTRISTSAVPSSSVSTRITTSAVPSSSVSTRITTSAVPSSSASTRITTSAVLPSSFSSQTATTTSSITSSSSVSGVAESTSMVTSIKPTMLPTTGSIELTQRPWTDVKVDDTTETDTITGPTSNTILSQASTLLILVLITITVAFHLIQ